MNHAGRAQAHLASDKAPDAGTIWKGAVIAAQGQKLPTALLDWNSRNKTTVERGPAPSYRPGMFWGGTMYLDQISILRLTRIGQNGNFNPQTDQTAFGTIYNEAFHAWFLSNDRSLGWLHKTMDSQQQFGGSTRFKAEEAMSETVNQIVNDIDIGRGVLSYDDLMALKPTDERRQNLTPGHNEPDQQWAKDPGSRKEMSEELYYATIWIMYNGDKDPAPKSGNRLAATKEFFAKTFHPQWTPKQVHDFATAVSEMNRILRRQFTLPDLMALVAGLAVVLAVLPRITPLLAAIAALFVTPYLLATKLSVRARAICAACFVLLAILPWVSIEAGYIYVSGLELKVPFPSDMRGPLGRLYRVVVEGPLFPVSPDESELYFALFFSGEGVVTARPTAVSVFWLIPALALLTSLGVSRFRESRDARPRNLESDKTACASIRTALDGDRTP